MVIVLNDYCCCLLFLSALTRNTLEGVLTKYDVKRLDLYSRNMVDYHLITDLLPSGKISLVVLFRDVSVRVECLS